MSVDRLDEVLGRRVSLRSLALLRMMVGLIAAWHLWPFLRDALDGHQYRDMFYEPYGAWYPELPRGIYTGLLAMGLGAALAMSLGVLTRLSCAVTFGVVAYNLFLSTTHVHNNRAFLVIILAGLAVAPTGRELSVDAWLRARHGLTLWPLARAHVLAPLDPTGPAWPLWLLRLEAVTVYGASGLSKLLDPDWFGGTVTWHRIVLQRHRLEDSPLPDWSLTLLTDRTFHTYSAKVIVLTELFIALGLCWRRTRYAAVWVAVCFHIAIQLTASVEVFSYLALAALVIWAVPSTRDRTLLLDPTSPRQRRLRAVVDSLDWLARFSVVAAPAGAPVQVVDRDGSVREGAGAVALVLSRLPLTAWFALPTLLLPSLRRGHRSGGSDLPPVLSQAAT